MTRERKAGTRVANRQQYNMYYPYGIEAISRNSCVTDAQEWKNKNKKQTSSVALVRERSIPIE
jgi:hypothetical protein